MIEHQGPGRPGLYPVIMAALDPSWVYSPATVAEFAASFGFLDAINPSSEVSLSVKKTRTRVALCRHTNLKGFPMDGDTQILVRGRWFSAWEGWRWRGEANEDAAWAETDRCLSSIWTQMEAGGQYAIKDVWDLCESSELPPPPRVFEGREEGDAVWRMVHTLTLRVQALCQANYLGLNLEHAHGAEVWSAARDHGEVELSGFQTVAIRLRSRMIYSLAQIMHMGVDYGIISGFSHSEMMAVRCNLYRYARFHQFPDFGDAFVLLGGAQVPGWTGERWRRALFNEF